MPGDSGLWVAAGRVTARCGSRVLNPFWGSTWGAEPCGTIPAALLGGLRAGWVAKAGVTVSGSSRSHGQRRGRKRGVLETGKVRLAGSATASGGLAGGVPPSVAPIPVPQIPVPQIPHPVTCPGSRSGARRGRGQAVAPRDVTGGGARTTSGGDVSGQKGAESRLGAEQ